MNLDYLLDDVTESERPLDYDAILRSRVPLHIYATNLKLAQDRPVELPHAETKADLRRNFRASALIPLAAGPPVKIGDGLFCDAGIWDSIPYQFAEEGGATHILVLQSRPLNNPRRRPRPLERVIAPFYFGRVAPPVLEGYRTRVDRYNEECRRLSRLSLDLSRAPSLLALTPAAEVTHVRSFERNRERLVAGAVSGFHAVCQAFLGTEPEVVEILTPMRDGRRVRG
jgi:predicted patatin/cPLA2 family phospholipase